MDTLTDKELVVKALKDPEAFGEVMTRYTKPLSRYIVRITNASADECDDILQNTFIKTFRNLREFDQKLTFSSWIYRIAHNESIDHVRKRKNVSIDPVSDEDPGIGALLTDDTDIMQESHDRMRMKHIEKVLGQLRPEYRSVLVLKFLEEKDYNEISDILRKPTGTVGTLINRAKKEFKIKATELGLKEELI